MTTVSRSVRSLFVTDLGPLLAALRRRGRVIGPTLREGAVALGEIERPDDLPRGWIDEQEAGLHRLRREGDRLFGITLAPESYKRYLYPPRLGLWRMQARTLEAEPVIEAVAPFTLLGLRACDLAAIRVLDRVLLEGQRVDTDYRRRRGAALLVAVACARSAPTCFCASTGTGPRPESGYDLLLSELDRGFLVEAGSRAGERVLAHLPGRSPARSERAAALAAVSAAARQQRALPAGAGARLAERWDDPRWTIVADRCLACGNCTQVCPTCFCVAAEQTVDLAATVAEQSRRWDSCFAPEHSYVHGGAVRASRAARYRQWLTHKLSTWNDQFGTAGCVGCGRCIAWCPAAIDLTEEARALMPAPGGARG